MKGGSIVHSMVYRSIWVAQTVQYLTNFPNFSIDIQKFSMYHKCIVRANFSLITEWIPELETNEGEDYPLTCSRGSRHSIQFWVHQVKMRVWRKVDIFFCHNFVRKFRPFCIVRPLLVERPQMNSLVCGHCEGKIVAHSL